MKLLYDGKEYDAVQLATVGTLPGYRNQGLSRILFERNRDVREKILSDFGIDQPISVKNHKSGRSGRHLVLGSFPKSERFRTWGFSKISIEFGE